MQKNQTQLCSLPVKIQTTYRTDRPIPQQIIYKTEMMADAEHAVSCEENVHT
jgi:hypothetical protein